MGMVKLLLHICSGGSEEGRADTALLSEDAPTVWYFDPTSAPNPGIGLCF